MFSLEIEFQDDKSAAESLILLRPLARVGSSEQAHVAIEEMKALGFEVDICRDLGARFRCIPLPSSETTEIPPFIEGTYEGETEIDLGVVRLRVTALDTDLGLKPGEPIDKAGVRICRQACSQESPRYPAILIPGEPRMLISFAPDQTVFIGRSNECAVRIEAADISQKHARIGFESGSFWIEDLGSTNGTFVNNQQISGRMNVPAGQPILLGREHVIVGVSGDEHISDRNAHYSRKGVVATEERFPSLVAVSEIARPARVALQPGARFVIGRDPASDMWLGAPHVSRRHLIVDYSKTGRLVVMDQSTNGTLYDDGKLSRGDVIELREHGKVFNFGEGITIAVCFSEEQERTYRDSDGAPTAFGFGPGTSEYAENMFASVRRASLERDRTHTGTHVRPPTALEKLNLFYRSLPTSRRVLLACITVILAMFVAIMVNLVLGLL